MKECVKGETQPETTGGATPEMSNPAREKPYPLKNHQDTNIKNYPRRKI